MKKFWQISVYLVILLGITHACCTPLFYKVFNLDAIWFFSCGLLLVYQGFINIVTWQSGKKNSYMIAIIANLISVALLTAIFWFLREIQAMAGIVLSLAVLTGSIFQSRKI